MPAADDMTLLQAYVQHSSEECFATLVERHVNLVYSAALRQVGNPHVAEEITQAVFVVLARKARHLGDRVVISGWLYKTARLTAVTFIRSESRRHHREQEAFMETTANQESTDVWPELAPLLDEAMAALNETDRNAVVLRYFDGRTLKEVGAALGSTEEAAKKRVQRAIERLRIFFSRRGVSLTTPVIAGAMLARSVQAAPALVIETVKTVAVAKGVAASTSTSTLIDATMKLMTWTKLKFAAVTAAGLLLASGTAIVAVRAAVAHVESQQAEQIFDLYSQVFAQGLRGQAAAEAVDQAMKTHPPVALIRLSPVQRPFQFGAPTGMRIPRGSVSLKAPLIMVIRYVCGLAPQFPQARIIVPPELETSRYDYVDTMPQGGPDALRLALKDQFGLISRREMRPNLVLTLSHSTSGLHKHTAQDESKSGSYRVVNVSMADFAEHLSKILGVTVTDQTGLTGGYDFTLNLQSPVTTEGVNRSLLDQLGLELKPDPDTAPVEFLVTEKVR